MGIICTRCFTDNPSNFRFCDNCGSSLVVAAAAAAPVVDSDPMRASFEPELGTLGNASPGANLADLPTMLVGRDVPSDQQPQYQSPAPMPLVGRDVPFDQQPQYQPPAPMPSGFGSVPSDPAMSPAPPSGEPTSWVPSGSSWVAPSPAPGLGAPPMSEASPSVFDPSATFDSASLIDSPSVALAGRTEGDAGLETPDLGYPPHVPGESLSTDPLLASPTESDIAVGGSAIPYEPIEHEVIPYEHVAENSVSDQTSYEHVQHDVVPYETVSQTIGQPADVAHAFEHPQVDAVVNNDDSLHDAITSTVNPNPYVDESVAPIAPVAEASPAIAVPLAPPVPIESPVPSPIPSVLTQNSSPNTVILRADELAALLNRTARLVPRLFGTVTEERSIRIDGQVSIGRFDPATGPVDIDLSTFPGAEHVTKRHGFVEPGPSGWTVRDNNSTNGIYVRRAPDATFGPRIIGALELFDGDEISFANVSFVFRTTP
jgi:FHA domain